MSERVCFSCETKVPEKEFACRSCRKAVRANISVLKTVEELYDFKCPGHGVEEKSASFRRGAWGNIYSTMEVVAIRNPKTQSTYFDNGCSLCASEMRKEFETRKRKLDKEKKLTAASTESLAQKCARVIAMDPGLLLIGAVHEPPLTSQMWRMIHDAVPKQLNKAYNEALVESEKTNESEWMYATIGAVFSRFSGSVGQKRRKIKE